MKFDSFYCGVCLFTLTVSISMYSSSLNDITKIVLMTIYSIIGSIAIHEIIPKLGEKLIQKGIFGKDINKGTDTKVPESMGLIIGLIFFCVTILFSAILKNEKFLISIIVILFSYLIGLIDDFIDIRWRYKLILSFCSSVIITSIYPGNCELFGFNLSFVYLFMLILLTVFFINSINMYAGVNGLESGQCLIISIFSIIHCVIQMMFNESEKVYESSLLSLYLLIPFACVTFILFLFNKFPSKVFVGDSFTYFAGGALGVASIVGGFDRLMLLFFFPALINFVISIPQLIGILPCPRHRLPKLNKETGKLECIPTNLTMLNLILRIVGPKTEHQLVNIALILQIVSCAFWFIFAYFMWPSLFLNTF